MNKETEIFNWLLGLSGDFPPSEPEKRYGFRSELRKKLLDAGYSFNEKHETIAPSGTQVMREALEKLKNHIREELMFTMENGRQPREGKNDAYYNVIESIDDLLSSSGQGDETKGEDWISVEDGFPPKESKFYYWLYCEKYNNYEQGEYDYDGQIFVDKFGARLYHTSHWKIPKPPYKK